MKAYREMWPVFFRFNGFYEPVFFLQQATAKVLERVKYDRLLRTHTERLVEKLCSWLCQVLIPACRNCDLTRKYMSIKSGRSHESADANSQDLPQPCVAAFSTRTEVWTTSLPPVI